MFRGCLGTLDCVPRKLLRGETVIAGNDYLGEWGLPPTYLRFNCSVPSQYVIPYISHPFFAASIAVFAIISA